MITRVPKTPQTVSSYQKPALGKFRATQVPKGSASAKGSLYLNTQASESSLGMAQKPKAAMGSVSSNNYQRIKPTISLQNPGNRFTSPKVSASIGSLSKTASMPHETRKKNMSSK